MVIEILAYPGKEKKEEGGGKKERKGESLMSEVKSILYSLIPPEKRERKKRRKAKEKGTKRFSRAPDIRHLGGRERGREGKDFDAAYNLFLFPSPVFLEEGGGGEEGGGKRLHCSRTTFIHTLLITKGNQVKRGRAIMITFYRNTCADGGKEEKAANLLVCCWRLIFRGKEEGRGGEGNKSGCVR